MDECKCLGILQNNGGALQLSFSCVPPSHGVCTVQCIGRYRDSALRASSRWGGLSAAMVRFCRSTVAVV